MLRIVHGAEACIANFSFYAEDTLQLLRAGTTIFLVPFYLKLFVAACTGTNEKTRCTAIAYSVCSSTMGWFARDLYGALQLFKRCLKAYSTITGVVVSRSTATITAVKLYKLSILYPVLVSAQCYEQAEHMFETVWPKHYTVAGKRASRISTYFRYVRSCASDTAVLVWTILWAIALYHSLVIMGPALKEVFSSEWWST